MAISDENVRLGNVSDKRGLLRALCRKPKGIPATQIFFYQLPQTETETCRVGNYLNNTSAIHQKIKMIVACKVARAVCVVCRGGLNEISTLL